MLFQQALLCSRQNAEGRGSQRGRVGASAQPASDPSDMLFHGHAAAHAVAWLGHSLIYTSGLGGPGAMLLWR